ncbi:nose resistant to fluoxetine protein 6-like isoform X1 [Diorhabda carinulata]|uniref:nose resistant to fluoxetine protein 6-like isoform X1 n=1 Tax=Diorhabda carinulata TaxID=1163345 RepID=UPI0025A1E929|nr:nose resistant to fluoxetine protein 6-like isoform X1 [Diorhabda carinulata]
MLFREIVNMYEYNNHSTLNNKKMKISWKLFVFCGVISTVISDYTFIPPFNISSGTSIHSTALSRECLKDFTLYLETLNETKSDGDNWALQMFDATAKFPSGLLSYNFAELGNFQQCINIKFKNISGKYCLGNAVVNRSVIYETSNYSQRHVYLKNLMMKVAEGHIFAGNLKWGICLPDGCTEKDALQLMRMTDTLNMSISSVICQTKYDPYLNFNVSEIYGTTIFSTFFLIIIISTLLDTTKKSKEKGMVYKTFKAFSLLNNFKLLFTIPKRNSMLSCLDGIRVISMIWIVTLHVYLGYLGGPLVNSKDFVNFTDSWPSMFIYNGGLACDTFLLIGGILVTYVFFKKNQQHNMTFTKILKHYLHRYIRLTPSVVGVVLLHITVVKYLGSGPNWTLMVDLAGRCQKSWWSTILYIQNIVNVDKMCADQTWYLNVDMQLYLMSPLIFWSLKKSPRLGIALLLLSAFLSMFLSFTRAYSYEMSAITNTHYLRGDLDVYMNQYYFKTETRATPWLLGAILGYVLSRTDKIIKLGRIHLICLWVLNLTIIVTCILSGHSTLRSSDYRRLENSLAIALVRPFFATSVGWIIWACATEHGGIINKFLSLSIFQFLNKFIFSVYLLHVTILKIIFLSVKTPMYFGIFNMVYDVCGILMIMFWVSILWILVFESPLIEIEKMIFSK